MLATCRRGGRRYQLVPIGLSLALAAFFKRAQLSGFVELDKVTRQLHAAHAAAQATPTTATATATRTVLAGKASRSDFRRLWASRRRGPGRLLIGR